MQNFIVRRNCRAAAVALTTAGASQPLDEGDKLGVSCTRVSPLLLASGPGSRSQDVLVLVQKGSNCALG